MLRKATALLGLSVLLVGLLLPLKSLADGSYLLEGGGTATYEGIVPCGKPVTVSGVSGEQTIHCQLCHFFVMIDGIIDYVLIKVVPPLTVLMLVIGGVMFYFGGAKPELLSKSKTLFKGVIIGLVLIYGAYMIVGLALSLLGAADVNPVSHAFNSETGVFKINCPIKAPPSP